MLVYKGINALADFRRQSLLKSLKKIDKSITDVRAEYIHFVDTPKLDVKDEQKLRLILEYGVPFRGSSSQDLLLVVPRLGSISPWSSKATDIAHSCGLSKLKRIERGTAYYVKSSKKEINKNVITPHLHDRMIESVLYDLDFAKKLFKESKPKPVREIDIKKGGKKALAEANKNWGLALSEQDIDYLYGAYHELKRNPTDAELMMFALINSEHCRHKIFNADWIIDGKPQTKSLFKMIKNTYEINNEDILSAYSDNAAVLRGASSDIFFPDPEDKEYRHHKEPANIVIKVETHNHPTAIAPFPGAATGSGGEIRDEGATGRGAKPKIGLSGFNVSNLNLPKASQPWEKSYGRPSHISSPLDIMIEAPIGAAAFNNEFGRPNLAGYFRTYEQNINGELVGYHKPIMIAGGLGNIRDRYIQKKRLPVGAKLIVLGGPSMLIGLAGGTASSMQAGSSDEDLDFASVQRANAEIQRRVQEVINTCWSMDEKNPIISIHDVGAGGLSNAFPELVHDSVRGAKFELRNVPNADFGMSPMEIWSNEAQERYVLGIDEKDLEKFTAICEHERCPFAVIGEATKEKRLVVHDNHFKNNFIDLPMSVLFGKSSKMSREFNRSEKKFSELKVSNINIDDAVERILKLPAVASKKFLITIGDRTVGGLCVRDQMVGPWQVPVGDVAVSASGFNSTTGEAMAMGERPPIALIDGPSSGRMAVGEAITNMAAANIEKLSDIKLSANWMAAAGHKQEDEKLYDTVHALGEEFCPTLGVTIPVGKDSLSMRTVWEENGVQKSVTAPLSLVISAFAPVVDVGRSLTPELKTNMNSELILIDLGAGKNRLGASALAQVYNQLGRQAPDADANLLKNFFKTMQELNKQNKILAYHDRSDGGLFTTLCEMAFAARCGLEIDTKNLSGSNLEQLFNEELGAVIQVLSKDVDDVARKLEKSLGKIIHRIGNPSKDQQIKIKQGKKIIYRGSRAQLESWWAETSYRIQSLRDNPTLASNEFRAIQEDNPGISPNIKFELLSKKYKTRPKVAILREQGVNGQIEMAAAFDKAGFKSVDIHLNDLMKGQLKLDDFVGLAACGGFSYGDVLGAGEGWAKSILFNPVLRKMFTDFFGRKDTFSLGVCNGCQMLAALKELIPGADSWPRFLKNTSEQFEARLVSVQIKDSPSLFFEGMAGSIIPIPVAHGEGKTEFDRTINEELVSMQYVDNRGVFTEQYPYNPNGSRHGITALTTPDGRVTIMMPHPERAFLTKQFSWHPVNWQENGPWLRMFQNAREWVEKNS